MALSLVVYLSVCLSLSLAMYLSPSVKNAWFFISFTLQAVSVSTESVDCLVIVRYFRSFPKSQLCTEEYLFGMSLWFLRQ